jgi:hypothetical protein
MDQKKLGLKLKEMYDNAPRGEQVAMIHLFGIKYPKEIKEAGVKNVVIEAGISSTYVTEVSKGMSLSKYVKIL